MVYCSYGLLLASVVHSLAVFKINQFSECTFPNRSGKHSKWEKDACLFVITDSITDFFFFVRTLSEALIESISARGHLVNLNRQFRIPDDHP